VRSVINLAAPHLLIFYSDEVKQDRSSGTKEVNSDLFNFTFKKKICKDFGFSPTNGCKQLFFKRQEQLK